MLKPRFGVCLHVMRAAARIFDAGGVLLLKCVQEHARELGLFVRSYSNNKLILEAGPDESWAPILAAVKKAHDQWVSDARGDIPAEAASNKLCFDASTKAGEHALTTPIGRLAWPSVVLVTEQGP